MTSVMFAAIDEDIDSPDTSSEIGIIEPYEFYESIRAMSQIKKLGDTISKKSFEQVRNSNFYNQGGPGDFRKRGLRR